MLFAYFLAAESRSAGGPRPALCKQIKHVARTGHSLKIQVKSASNPIHSSASSYQNSFCCGACDRGRVSARQPRYFLLLRQKTSTQRKGDPTVRVHALRFTSLRANLRHAIQSAVRQNSLCAARAAQARCRKSDHEATLSCGSVARSPNSVPQALTHGWMRVRTACEICDELGFYLNLRFVRCFSDEGSLSARRSH